MKEIIYYDLSGKIQKREQLNNNTIEKCNGMKIRCWMKDNSQKVGFADVFRIHDENDYDGTVKDHIYLCTFDNLDEDKNQLIGNDDAKYEKSYIKIEIEDIKTIEAILHSSPRWGTSLTNKFHFSDSKKYE